MANLIIQENGVARTLPALNGEEITIQAPCDCSAVTGVQIAGVVYPFYDAAGNVLPMGTGLFSEGNLIRVLIDTVNTRATIINHAITPASIGAPTVAEMEAAIAAIPTPDVSGQINTHNTSGTAHQDIRTAVNGKASTVTYTVSIPASWSENSAGGYIQTVTVSGIQSTDNPIADVVLGADVDANALYVEAWSLITRITTAAGSITLYANGDAPETAFTIQLKAVR